jgi:hypothetical protein
LKDAVNYRRNIVDNFSGKHSSRVVTDLEQHQDESEYEARDVDGRVGGCLSHHIEGVSSKGFYGKGSNYY